MAEVLCMDERQKNGRTDKCSAVLIGNNIKNCKNCKKTYCKLHLKDHFCQSEEQLQLQLAKENEQKRLQEEKIQRELEREAIRAEQKLQEDEEEKKEETQLFCQFLTKKATEQDIIDQKIQICGDQLKRDQRHKCKQCYLPLCKYHLGIHESQDDSCESVSLAIQNQEGKEKENKSDLMEASQQAPAANTEVKQIAVNDIRKTQTKQETSTNIPDERRQNQPVKKDISKPFEDSNLSQIQMAEDLQNQSDLSLLKFIPGPLESEQAQNRSETVQRRPVQPQPNIVPETQQEDIGHFPSLIQASTKLAQNKKSYKYKPMPAAQLNTESNHIAGLAATSIGLQEALREYQESGNGMARRAEDVIREDLFSKIVSNPQAFAKLFSWNDPTLCPLTREKEPEKVCETCNELCQLSRHICHNVVSEYLDDKFFFNKQRVAAQNIDDQPLSNNRIFYEDEPLDNSFTKLRTKCIKNIAGHEIKFPYESYPIQDQFMQNVIVALMKGYHCLQEMPTGTGKTLSLLSSLLAYQQTSRRRENWQILYVSRTHTQVKQMVHELKQKSCYKPKMTVLAGKEKMCINQTIIERARSGDTPLNTLCKQAQVGQIQPCSYYKGQSELDTKSQQSQPLQQIMDIEELQNFGRENSVCPYLLSKFLIPDVDIIFTVYAYALSPQIVGGLVRQAEESGRNLILVYDEAHNVPEQAEQFCSIGVEEKTINDCLDFYQGLEDYLNNVKADTIIQSHKNQINLSRGNMDEVDAKINNCREYSKSLYQLAYELKQSIDEAKRQHIYQNNTYDYDEGSEESKWLVSENEDQIIHLLGDEYESFEQKHKISKIPQLINLLELYPFSAYCKYISDINDFRQMIGLASQNPRAFKLLLVRDMQKKYKLLLRCFDPSLIFKTIQKKNRIILTSGSLAPLKSFEDELCVNFRIQASIPHVIAPQNIADHVRVKVISHGLDGKTALNLMHTCLYTQERRSLSAQGSKIIEQLGKTILYHIRNIPNGVVIFFSSRTLLYTCRDQWQSCASEGKRYSIYDEFEMLKEIYIEPNTQRDVVPVFREYKREAMTQRGALLFAVCRGRLAEGIDFKDELARAIFIVAVPNLAYQDLEINLKKRYLEQRQQGLGKQWYEQQTQRAINQAAGRILRHNKDYGAVFLLDDRFVQRRDRFKGGLSSWMKPLWDEVKNHEKTHEEILQFIWHNKNAGKSTCDNKEDALFDDENAFAVDEADVDEEQEERQRRIYTRYLNPSDTKSQLQKGLIYEGIFRAFDRVDFIASVHLVDASAGNREVKIKSRIAQNRAMHGSKVFVTFKNSFERLIKKLRKELQKLLEYLVIPQDLRQIMGQLEVAIQFEKQYQGVAYFEYLREQTLSFLRACEYSVPRQQEFDELRDVFRKFARQVEFIEIEGEVVGILSCPYNKQTIINGVIRREFLTENERYWFFPFDTKLPKLAISKHRFGELAQNKLKRSEEEELYAEYYFQANIIEWGKQQFFPQIKLGLGQQIEKNEERFVQFRELFMQDQGLECLIDRQQDQTLFENRSVEYRDLIMLERDKRMADQKCNLTNHKYTLTIDDKETVTRDDAFTFIPAQKEGESATLLIHISDVSFILKENEPLELLARKRISNAYFNNFRYSMLPETFCEWFSINPKLNRLAVTLVFRITKDKIKFVEYFRSVIKSRVALSYEDAQSLIKEKQNDQQVPKWFLDKEASKLSYPKLQEIIKFLSESLLNYRQRQIKKHGALEFDEIVEPEDLEAHNLVKMLMVMCNKRVAKIICQRYPQNAFVRSCALANRFRLQQLSAMFDQIGVPFDYSSTQALRECIDLALKKNNPQSRALANSLHWFSGMPNYTLYQGVNKHISMGNKPYTQFTSPIRRYADLLTHKQLFAQNEQEACLQEGVVEEINTMVDKIRRIEKLVRRQYYYSQVKKEMEGVKSLRAIAMTLNQKKIGILLVRDEANIKSQDRKSLPTAVQFSSDFHEQYIIHLSIDRQTMYFLYHDLETNEKLNDYVIKIRQAEANQKIELLQEYKKQLDDLLYKESVFELNVYDEFQVELKVEGTFPYDGYLRIRQEGQFDEQKKLDREKIKHQLIQRRLAEEEERKKRIDKRKKLNNKSKPKKQESKKPDDSDHFFDDSDHFFDDSDSYEEDQKVMYVKNE